MKKKHVPPVDDYAALEAAAAAASTEVYDLVLFVCGTTPNSIRAIANTRRLCETHLPGRHELTIVDLYQNPELARGAQVIAAPTLLRRLPEPVRRLVGDMFAAERILLPLHRKPPARLPAGAG